MAKCSSVSLHCCDRMDHDLNQTCDVHEGRFDCPDALMTLVRGGYGLIVHDADLLSSRLHFALGAAQVCRKLVRFQTDISF